MKKNEENSSVTSLTVYLVITLIGVSGSVGPLWSVDLEISGKDLVLDKIYNFAIAFGGFALVLDGAQVTNPPKEDL